MRIERTAFVILVILCSLIMFVPESLSDSVDSKIEIREDGSIYPDDVPLRRDGNVYTFTGDLKVSGTAVAIKKGDIVIDGAGYTLQGREIKYGVVFGATEQSDASRQNVTIKNLNINGFRSGIMLDDASHNVISNCTLSGNIYGIVIGYNADYNQIVGNRLTQGNGIIFDGESIGNIVEGNVLEGNGNQGILVYHSLNHTISQNTITNCTVHLYGDGFEVSNNYFVYSPVQLLGNFHTFKDNEFVNCTFVVDDLQYSEGLNSIDTSNTVNGKPSYYLVDEKDRTISSDVGQIILIRCDNITLQNLHITHNTKKGIYLVKTNNSLITQNTISFNRLGIALLNSENNTISYNTISENDCGIEVRDSSLNQIVGNNFTRNDGFAMEFLDAQGNNTIYRNIFVSNHAGDADLQVSMPGYGDANIANSNFWDKDGEGNFWSDYKARYIDSSEINGTGIGDTPFFINENNIDHYPLLKPSVIPEFTSWTPLLFLFSATVAIIVLYRRRLSKNQGRMR